MKTGSHCLSECPGTVLKIFNKSCCFLPPRHPQCVFRHFWLPVSSTFPSQLNLFPMVFFLFEIMKFHCSLLLLPCSFGLFIYLCGHVHAMVYMEVKGQPPGVDFLLSPCGVQGLSSVFRPACKAFPCWTIWRPPLFPLLWGILLPFFLHVLQKAWFGPDEKHNMDSSSVWASHHFPVRVHIQGSRLGTTGQSGLAARSLLAWEPSLAMQISPSILVLMGMLYSKSSSHPQNLTNHRGKVGPPAGVEGEPRVRRVSSRRLE